MKSLNVLLTLFTLVWLVSCSQNEVTNPQGDTPQLKSEVSKATDEVVEEDNDGVSEREIDPQSLSKEIKDNIELKYPRAELLEVDEITHLDGTITYDVEIRHANTVTELMYDADGDFLGVEGDGEEDGEQTVDDDESGR